MSVEVIVLIRLCFSTAIALVLINLIFVSWRGRTLYLRLLFLDIALLGPMALYTILNDFWIEADQYWGLALLTVGLAHRKLFTESHRSVKHYPVESLLSLLFGASFLFVGHPSWYIVLFFSFVLFVLRERHRWLSRSQRLFKFATLVPLLVLPTLTLFELLKSSQSSNRSYVAQGSIWDIFSCDRLSCLIFPPVAAIAQPVLRIGNAASSQTEFFNGLMVLVLIPVLWSSRRMSTALIGLLKHWFATCLLIVMALMFGGALANSSIPIISSLFSFNILRLAHSLLIITTFCFAVYLGSDVHDQRKSSQCSRIESPLVLFSITIALLSPIVMFGKDVGFSPSSVFRDRFIREDGRQAKNSDLVQFGERFAFFNEGESKDDYRDPYFSEIFGLNFDLQLARAGFPTLQSFGAARISETLTQQAQNFRSSNWLTTENCQPEVLEFLAVSSIFVDAEDTSGCREKLLAYFGEDSIREINKVSGKPGTISLFRPKNFSTWSILTSSTTNSSASCPLLEQDCLRGLEVKALLSSREAPLRLCENDCLFTYSWSRTKYSEQILLPINFDGTIEIKDSLTGKKRRTANYLGLLAVQVDGDEMSGIFMGNVQPDVMMWLRVLVSYLHTMVFVGALGVMLVKGIRVVKEISRASDSKPVG